MRQLSELLVVDDFYFSAVGLDQFIGFKFRNEADGALRGGAHQVGDFLPC